MPSTRSKKTPSGKDPRRDADDPRPDPSTLQPALNTPQPTLDASPSGSGRRKEPHPGSDASSSESGDDSSSASNPRPGRVDLTPTKVILSMLNLGLANANTTCSPGKTRSSQGLTGRPHASDA